MGVEGTAGVLVPVTGAQAARIKLKIIINEVQEIRFINSSI